ncbi:MAG: RluA family pseudouridine synthase [Treponema sp.]|nr:RluA family pseudouridine synthase [Treponema sp.]
MEFEEFTAGENDSGRRLDRVLRIMLRERALDKGINIFSALRKRLVLVNGKKAEASQKVCPGDSIKIASFLLKESKDPAERKDFTPKEQKGGCKSLNFSLDSAILFKNDSIMVINKPYGLNVQPSFSSETSLAQIVAKECKEGLSLSFTPAPLHRLDRFTTGALVFSLSIQGAQIFSQMIKDGLVKKTYLGIVQGRMEGSFEWTDGIEESNSPSATSFHTVRVVKSNAPIAVTRAFPLEYGSFGGKEVTLVRFEIPTGRKHQIRAQSAFHGFPLFGDRAYGGTKASGHEFFLHAIQVEFPEKNDLSIPQKILAPLPEDFLNFLNSALINWKGQLII